MDASLELSRTQGLAPFDGVTIWNDTDCGPALSKLRALAIEIVGILEGGFPEPSLFVLDDWHEHDGFINASTATTWIDVRKRLSSDDEFLYFSTGDDLVSKALYPKSKQFYLRIYLDQEDPAEEQTSEIDVTVPLPLASAILEAFTSNGLSPKSESAKSFFGRRYGG